MAELWKGTVHLRSARVNARARLGLATTGKGVAVRGFERHSNGEAKLSKEPQWRGGAMMSSNGSGIDGYVRQRLWNAMCGNGTVEI